MSPVQRFTHGLVVVMIGVAALLALAVGSVSLAIAQFVPGEPVLPTAWVGVPIAFVPAIIAAGAYAITRRLRWCWLGFAALPIAAALVFLSIDDNAPPPLPHLGPRVGADDPGYRYLMWLSEKAPHSRLREAGAPSADPDHLRLPKESVDWSKYAAENKVTITQAVAANTIGREWIAKLSDNPPAGICPLVDLDHMLSYRAVRNTAEPLLALAYAQALEGNPDEAVRVTLQLVRAMHNLQRTSANLVHAMIANVVLKRCYAVLDEILRLSPMDAATSAQLEQALDAAPPIRQVFRNAFLGEADFIHFVFDRVRRGAYDVPLSFSASQNRRLEQIIRIGGPLVFHPNRTERQLQSVYAQMGSVAEERNDSTLATWVPDWGDESQLRNPGGRLLGATIIPAFAKLTNAIWKAEDLRRELLAKARAPQTATAPTP